MLIKNTNTKDCWRYSLVGNGDCCCNCKHRYTLTTCGIPTGFVCKLIFEKNDTIIVKLPNNGHSMCEMHERNF